MFQDMSHEISGVYYFWVCIQELGMNVRNEKSQGDRFI